MMRIADLKRRETMAKRLLNVMVPVKLDDTIRALARKLGVPKTAVIVALLNEGLTVAARKTKPGRGN